MDPDNLISLTAVLSLHQAPDGPLCYGHQTLKLMINPLILGISGHTISGEMLVCLCVSI